MGDEYLTFYEDVPCEHVAGDWAPCQWLLEGLDTEDRRVVDGEVRQCVKCGFPLQAKLAELPARTSARLLT